MADILLRMLVLMGLSALAGCGMDATWPDLEKEILSNLKPVARHGDTYKPPAPSVFNANNYRSPFEPLRLTDSVRGNPLIAWPLSSLQFTGTVVGSNGVTGFIMAPDNKIYQVKEGDILGNRKGRIISIDSGKIVVRDAQGIQGPGSADNTVTLRLKGAD